MERQLRETEAQKEKLVLESGTVQGRKQIEKVARERERFADQQLAESRLATSRQRELEDSIRKLEYEKDKLEGEREMYKEIAEPKLRRFEDGSIDLLQAQMAKQKKEYELGLIEARQKQNNLLTETQRDYDDQIAKLNKELEGLKQRNLDLTSEFDKVQASTVFADRGNEIIKGNQLKEDMRTKDRDITIKQLEKEVAALKRVMDFEPDVVESADQLRRKLLEKERELMKLNRDSESRMEEARRRLEKTRLELSDAYRDISNAQKIRRSQEEDSAKLEKQLEDVKAVLKRSKDPAMQQLVEDIDRTLRAEKVSDLQRRKEAARLLQDISTHAGDGPMKTEMLMDILNKTQDDLVAERSDAESKQEKATLRLENKIKALMKKMIEKDEKIRNLQDIIDSEDSFMINDQGGMEQMLITEGKQRTPELRSGRKVKASGKGLDKRDWNYSGTIGLKGDLAEQEIDILEDQIHTLKDKLAEMEKRTSMQLMEERIKNQANMKEMEIKHEVALQNAKRYKRERPVDEDFTKPEGYIVSEETRVLLLDVLGKAAAALLHEAQKVMMQVDKAKLEREAKKIQGLVDSLEPVKAEQEARDISDSYELLGDARSHVHHGRLQLKKLRMTLGRHEESSGTGMALLMSDYDLTKEGVTESIKIIGDLPKIYYGEGGVDPKIIQKLRMTLGRHEES